MNLSEIAYPVFSIGSVKPSFEGLLCYYPQAYEDKEGNTFEVIRIVDDKAVPGKTLGIRRLKIKEEILGSQSVKLKRIGLAIYFLADLIKCAKSGKWFIDNNGMVFQYKKTKYVKLIYKKITAVHPVSTGGAVIEVEGLASRFKTLIAPKLHETYAAFLKDGMSYILYGIFDQPYDKSKRMI